MPAKLQSAAVIGLECLPVDVEVDVLSAGLHQFTLVGLPDASVREARERVSAALKNSAFRPPHQCGRITINLAPADLPKAQPIYDLPIALAFLLATRQAAFRSEKRLFLGELALDGRLRRVKGVLPIALYAREQGFEEICVPEENAPEAALVNGLRVIAFGDLTQAVQYLEGSRPITPFESPSPEMAAEDEIWGEEDMEAVRGQEHAKRALEIAAAGGHNILFVGPPGSGKTLLARAIPGILPPLAFEESLEVTKIFSVAGALSQADVLIRRRPFRAPHHMASAVSLIGGGSFPRPGEISLAHRGVLFLDEFAEFSRSVLENLRQPLEEGRVTVSRARGSLAFPARFMLVAAMNPCPCGFAGDPERVCACSPYQAAKYRQKISGPILDRIDLHIEVPRIKIEKLEDPSPRAEKSRDIRQRIEQARARQAERFAGQGIFTNAEMGGEAVRTFCRLKEEEKALLREAVSRLKLSARGYMRILKVARTIADLEGAPGIVSVHLAEALQYRFKEEA